MPSIFKTPFDDSSMDSNVENSDREVQNASADDEPITSIPRSSLQTPMPLDLARLSSANVQLPNLEPQQHSNLFYLALIEGRCRTQAANAVNARRRPEDYLPEESPEVLALTQVLLSEMTKRLHKAGILPSEFAGQNFGELRRTYLSSFDAILHKIATQKTHETYSSLDTSKLFALNRDFRPDSFEANSGALVMAPKELKNLLGNQLPNPFSLTLRGMHTEELSNSIYSSEVST